MSVLKKCKVVMLPTEKASHIHLNNGNVEEGQNLPEKLYFKEKEEEIAFKGNRIWKAQHLYILSDEKPKEGDWAICSDCNNSYQKLGKVSHVGQPFHFKNTIQINGNPDLHIDRHALDYCKKIIATTDKSLCVELPYGNKDFVLPQPSQSFIEKYIELYNKRQQITEVMVEYEETTFSNEQGIPNCFEGEVLNINPKDNTITIKRVKDSWSREEVSIKIYEALGYFASKYNIIIDGNELDDWVEENL